ncbi:unnamed protein product [Rotaria sp. Silwood2]|nr:unnamed protein product [Rotaria sp. Silwood2]CAF4287173.1 unnamed protein product [Rotaria sp. Silwood2]CAF4683971.1 unnamed protein product [Rotaria sp. Silwood2]
MGKAISEVFRGILIQISWIILAPHGALYEKQIIHSIHYQLKRDRLILRRTADQNNIYYFGCLDEFNAMANNYMENANCFEMIGIIDEFDSKQQQLTKTIKSIDLTLHELE